MRFNLKRMVFTVVDENGTELRKTEPCIEGLSLFLLTKGVEQREVDEMIYQLDQALIGNNLYIADQSIRKVILNRKVGLFSCFK